MAYEKQTWLNGDVITADKLNHIEDGLSNVETIKGDKGETGAKGADGKNGTDGVKGQDGSPGKDGASLKSIELTVDETGKVTGGTGVLTDNKTVPITIK